MAKISDYEKAIIQSGRYDLLKYCVLLQRNYEVNWHHRLIADCLQDVLNGEVKKLIVTVPPRHGKSELISTKFATYYLSKNPDKRVIVSSYSGELAQTFGSNARDIMNEVVYKHMFPEVTLVEDSQAKHDWKLRYRDDDKWVKGGGYYSVGVGGSTTGKGANLFIIDDPFKDWEEARSPTIRNKVWNWYNSVAESRLEKNAAVIIVMTRWHEDDLVGRLLEVEDDWVVVSLPALAEEDGHYRKKGESLWPNKYTSEHFEKIKKKDIVLFNCIYQQNPIQETGMVFKKEWITEYVDDPVGQMDIKIVVDPAISKKDTACNSAIICMAKQFYTEPIYILDVVLSKFDAMELVDQIIAMHHRIKAQYNYDPVVYIESVGYQEAIQHYLKERMRRDRYYFTVETFTPRKDKDARIRGLVPYLRQGILQVKSWMVDLVDEFIKYPNGKTVDGIDAVASGVPLFSVTSSLYEISKAKQKKGKGIKTFK